MITTIHDFEVIWRIKLSDGFFYSLKTDIVEDKYLKIVGGVEDILTVKYITYLKPVGKRKTFRNGKFFFYN